MSFLKCLIELIEAEQHDFNIHITDQFVKDFKDFGKSDKRVEKQLRYFIDGKRQIGLNANLGANDRAFTSTALSGFLHFHMVQGKVMLIYKYADNSIILMKIVKHDEYESQKRIKALASELEAMSPSTDYQLSDLLGDDVSDTHLSDGDRKKILDCLYLMCSTDADKAILVAFVKDQSNTEALELIHIFTEGEINMAALEENSDFIVQQATTVIKQMS